MSGNTKLVIKNGAREIDSPVKDLRTTIFWSPSVKTDENGKAKIVFYTGDRDSKMNIQIEGLTPWGEAFVKSTTANRGMNK